MMNASKGIAVFMLAAFALIPLGAQAEQGLNASSQTKVNNAKAQAWTRSNQGQKDPALQKRVVNMGSKRGGDCNVNVGTAQAGKRGGRQPKEIVVTTKEVINICK